MCKEKFNPMDHMMKLKGKDYLQVMWRLVWFREEHPDWGINTELVSHNEETKTAVFRATIFDENGVQKSCGFGSESVKDFGDYLEKAETKAVGRALAMLGYGTQFAPELDEEDRIVDSPVQRVAAFKCESCGVEIVDSTKKDGTPWKKQDIASYSKSGFGKVLCPGCMRNEFAKKQANKGENNAGNDIR